MLGLGDGVPRETVHVPAAPGSLVVFFTDGLVEATRDMDEGHRRLHAALGRDDVVHGREPARAIVRHVLGGTEATDDIAVLVARIAAAALERLGTGTYRRHEFHLLSRKGMVAR